MDFLDSILPALERYGLPTAALIVVVVLVVRVARFMSPIVTEVKERHIAFIDETSAVMKTQAETQAKFAATCEAGRIATIKRDETLEGIESAYVRLQRAGRHGCDVLEHVCEELGISDRTQTSIDAGKRDLGN